MAVIDCTAAKPAAFAAVGAVLLLCFAELLLVLAPIELL